MESMISQFQGADHSTIDIDAAMAKLPDLHQHVVLHTRRIELRGGDGSSCVLISKTELDSLERALEILSDTEEVRAMRGHLERLGAATQPV